MSDVTSFEDFWQKHEEDVLNVLADNDVEKTMALKLICHNSWLQSDVIRRREMLKMAQEFKAERDQNTGIMDSVNGLLDGLIKIARKLEQKSDNQPRDNDGSGQ